jgi:light-regulated signal transduction histidine kinase (bacteriophytochrome)
MVVKLLAELERSNTDLAQFAYVASHDLSEPLRMVSSYVQLLAHRYAGQLDADADEFIAFAVDGAARMKALIDDLLAYSRTGVAAVIRRPVDCGLVVRGALADLAVAITESGATVVVEDLPTVTGDPGQLAQVFENLLANALKFMPPDRAPEIRVSAERDGAAWCFAVEDNGIGIDEMHRARIFMMFKRLHGRAEYPGTGIGLALCHKIVSRLGGRICMDGRAGEGSVFRFTVPDAGVEVS